ncbi:hypothetical protein SAMN05216548_10537 [Faunimonas pinastri]|uniref:Uncharacterized protein n=1 Tax=Faunimonas pinastri TaxID=1855383 RepID=A0A1H9GGX8_9HYPH|nr:hypothetical protein [Faunimonas pinastri]SEQ49360.1 hypothetical protein SAMN05216548_10537 [Faunimonas pinastri]
MLTEHDWTPELVSERLVDSFRRLPDTPIYSPTRNSFIALDDTPIAGLALIEATSRALGRSSTLRVKILTWARARAVGISVRETCRQRGWAYASFKRDRNEAARQVAEYLSLQRVEALSKKSLASEPNCLRPIPA